MLVLEFLISYTFDDLLGDELIDELAALLLLLNVCILGPPML